MREKPWKAWEREVAERLGGNVVKASGATDYAKGDVKTERWLVDCKHTGLRTYTLTLRMWSALSSWARNEGREPLFALRLYERGEPVDILVMSEMAYAEGRDDYRPVNHSRGVENKSISFKLVKGGPYQFMLGKVRLVACLFEEEAV